MANSNEQLVPVEQRKSCFSPEAIERANAHVVNVQANLDITNADHIALWLEEHLTDDTGLGWLACRIVEAHEAALRTSPAVEPDEGLVWLAGYEWHKPAHRSVMASVRLGKWMSAALEDPSICEEMKSDIREWFSAGEPLESVGAAIATLTPSIRAQALEEAAQVAEWAHMVPPDGGSPSEAEHEVAKNAAAAIRALKGGQGV